MLLLSIFLQLTPSLLEPISQAQRRERSVSMQNFAVVLNNVAYVNVIVSKTISSIPRRIQDRRNKSQETFPVICSWPETEKQKLISKEIVFNNKKQDTHF